MHCIAFAFALSCLILLGFLTFEICHLQAWHRLLVSDFHFGPRWIFLTDLLLLVAIPISVALAFYRFGVRSAVTVIAVLYFLIDFLTFLKFSFVAEEPVRLATSAIPLSPNLSFGLLATGSVFALFAIIVANWKRPRANFKGLNAVTSINLTTFLFLSLTILSLCRSRLSGEEILPAKEIEIRQAQTHLTGSSAILPCKNPIAQLYLFGDYECPFTRIILNNLSPKQFPGIEVNWLNFPLYQIHPGAYTAAIASQIAAEQGDLQQVDGQIKLLCSLSDKFSLVSFERNLHLANPSKQQFYADVAKVNKEIANGGALGITQTPSAILIFNSHAYLLTGVGAIRHCPNWVNPSLAQPAKE